MSNSIKIAIASHKEYWMPSDQLYKPIHVGSALSNANLPYQRDDEGDSISVDNPRYCELTALWWMWKNSDADYIGLSHYRRHFAGSGERGVLTLDEATTLLAHEPVIVPKKRKYYIETIESHYSNTFDHVHLEILRNSIESLSPEYLPSFDAQMKKRSAHMFNMMVMRRDLAGEYCSWLFPVLRKTEQYIDFDNMTPFEARVMGRLSERLLDVWLGHTETPFVECPVVSMEKVNWIEKGSSFLAAKFLGKKYKESF